MRAATAKGSSWGRVPASRGPAGDEALRNRAQGLATAERAPRDGALTERQYPERRAFGRVSPFQAAVGFHFVYRGRQGLGVLVSAGVVLAVGTGRKGLERVATRPRRVGDRGHQVDGAAGREMRRRQRWWELAVVVVGEGAGAAGSGEAGTTGAGHGQRVGPASCAGVAGIGRAMAAAVVVDHWVRPRHQ